jgi:KaiC/GvpD/RAD55 family RecA-like ATPase
MTKDMKKKVYSGSMAAHFHFHAYQTINTGATNNAIEISIPWAVCIAGSAKLRIPSPAKTMPTIMFAQLFALSFKIRVKKAITKGTSARTGWEREHQFEEYLAQGVILLRTFPKDGRLVRVFQVEKMRGLVIDNQPRPYDISAKGIEVYSSATVYK